MKKRLILAVIFLFFLENISAQELNYSQAHIRYVQAELESGTEGDGTEAELSYDFHRLVFSLHVLKLDYQNDFTTISVATHVAGLGSYLHLYPGGDLFGSLQYGVYDLETTEAKLAETNVLIGKLGFRTVFNSNNEAQVYIGRLDYSGNDLDPSAPVRDQTVVGFRAILFGTSTNNVGFNAGVEVFDTYEHMSMGLTIAF